MEVGDETLDLLLPAVLLGWVAPDARAGEDPPWLVRFAHQYGGYATLQIELCGLLLPLREAPRAEGLVDSLEALADDGRQEPRIRRRPQLAPIHLTFGDRYGPAQLDLLQHLLATTRPALPPALSAHEALAELDAAEVAARFHGWPAVSLELPRKSHLADEDARDVVIGPLGVHEGVRVDDRLIEEVRSFLPGVPLRVFLLWTNSD